MSAVITRRIGSAMADGLSQINETPARLLERVQDMQTRIDRLTAQVEHQRATIESFQAARDSGSAEIHEVSGVTLNGRPVGSQRDFARLHNVHDYQVSRWCSRGDLRFIRRDGKYFVYLDQSCPPAKPRGRHKAS